MAIAPVILYPSRWMIVRVQDWLIICACARCPVSCVVERLAHVVQRTGEGIGYLLGRLVAQVTDTPLILVEQLVLATLQARMTARAFGRAGLSLLDAGELLVAVLDGRLCRA